MVMVVASSNDSNLRAIERMDKIGSVWFSLVFWDLILFRWFFFRSNFKRFECTHTHTRSLFAT